MTQRWPVPGRPQPIVVIGAGGIVTDAHLPAYAAVPLPVAGVFDLDLARARRVADQWHIPRVFASLAEAAASPGVVFDVATPPDAQLQVLTALPVGATVLMQKPMGRDLDEATRILHLCRARGLRAAVHFQLRFAPVLLALRAAIAAGQLGRVVECEVHVHVHTPWQRWPFLATLPRMEIALHSIHYLDAIRALLGEPRAVWARTVQHPEAPQLASSRTSAILEFGADVRCCLSINHHHDFGPRHQTSTLRVEGTDGAAVATLGVNLDYPRGAPDRLELARRGGPWQEIPLLGNWFPDAFRGPMCNLQRFAAGEDPELLTGVDSAWRTMAVVEACYASDRSGGTPVPGAPPSA